MFTAVYMRRVITCHGSTAQQQSAFTWEAGPAIGNEALAGTRRSVFFLFERSEFLIDASQKKSLRVCRVHACTRVRLVLVLVLGRQIVHGQNTVYLCLSKYIVFENTQL